MRVLRYHPRAATGDGGMSNAIRRWAVALSDLGVESAVAGDGLPAPETGPVAWVRVDHATVAGHRVPRHLERSLARFDVLVLHGGWTAHNVVAARAARRAGIPYLLEPRGAYDPHILLRRHWAKRGWWAMLEREVVSGARGIHIFFDTERPHLAALGVATNVVVAPNGVDVPAVPTWCRDTGGFVLWYGRFDLEHKGVDVLVDGVATLAEGRRPQLRLHGPDRRGDRARIERRVRALDLERWVSIGDPVYGETKEALLAECAAFAYPSRWEGFGIAPAEAVARGVPLLATPYPLAQALAEEGGAVVVQPTADELARGLEQVRGAHAAALAVAGRRAVSKRFRWSDVGRSWLRQVEAIL